MPCTDVSENLKLTLDYQDRVIYYHLAKDTCSGAVGKPSLLKKWIRNRPADEVLQATAETIHTFFPTRSKTWQFLYAKHLFAVQQALRALMGIDSARPEDYCAIHSIIHTPDGVEMYARLTIDSITDEIEACGGCASCGS